MIENGIKLRHLTTFLEVARLMSIGKAADVLAVTQPAVSKTIRELEEALGVALFDRSQRAIALTAFGEVFLRHAGTSVAALRQGVESVAQARGAMAPAVRVGALPTVSTRLMPLAVKRLKADGFTGIIRIITGENRTLLNELRLGELDLVVGRLAAPELMSGLTFEHLYSEQVVFAVRPGHPLTRERPFDIRRLSAFTVLMPTEGSVIRPHVEELLIAQGVGPLRDQIETVSMAFGRQFVRLSDAVWIISRGVVIDDLDAGILVELPVDTAETLGAVGLTGRAGGADNPAVELLAHAVRRVAAELAAPRESLTAARA